MTVKLDFAIANDRLYHISEELNRTVNYTCPFCSETVVFRKGDVKVHHFAHKPNSNCTASNETILHFNAKHYLQEECNNPSGYNIFFEFFLKNHSQDARNLSEIIDINDKLSFNLHDILVFYRALNGSLVEHMVGPYIADVYVESDNNRVGFVIEVCVTHEMEEEKRKYFKEKSIPYLEVIPESLENGHMKFILRDYNLPGFFDKYDEAIKERLVNFFYSRYKERVIEEARKPLLEEEIIKYKLKAVKALTNQIKYADLHKDIFNAFDQESNSIRVKAYNSAIQKTEPLYNVQYVASKSGKKFLMGNDKQYFISSEQNLLYEIINNFLNQYKVKALIGGWNDRSKKGIVGFEFSVPNSNKINENMKSIIIEVLKDFEDKFQKKLHNVTGDEDDDY